MYEPVLLAFALALDALAALVVAEGFVVIVTEPLLLATTEDAVWAAKGCGAGEAAPETLSVLPPLVPGFTVLLFAGDELEVLM